MILLVGFACRRLSHKPDANLTRHEFAARLWMIQIAENAESSFQRRSMRILLVEDHPALREIVTEYLVRRDFAVDMASKAEEACAALDLRLPLRRMAERGRIF
jgi:PleD family two-component response regulator